MKISLDHEIAQGLTPSARLGSSLTPVSTIPTREIDGPSATISTNKPSVRHQEHPHQERLDQPQIPLTSTMVHNNTGRLPSPDLQVLPQADATPLASSSTTKISSTSNMSSMLNKFPSELARLKDGGVRYKDKTTFQEKRGKGSASDSSVPICNL